MNNLTAFIAAVVGYLESPAGLAAWDDDRERGLPVEACYFHAIMAATGLRDYDEMRAVRSGIGPALNARRCGAVA